MSSVVRICVVGDEGVGKSSLLTSLVKDTFVTTSPASTLPPITIPPSLVTQQNVTITLVDTSALPQERQVLKRELRKANCILLVYSDHYSYERVALFWLPHFRSLGLNVPVVLCANKSDLSNKNGVDDGGSKTAQIIAEEMMPVMAEFKEIDSCIRTSAREHHNINEVFFLCQKAVTHPIAPLYDSKEATLKPAAIDALKRVFYLCDKDQDGLWDDQEVHDFQLRCFEKPLGEEDLASIKRMIRRWTPHHETDAPLEGIDMEGFLLLNKMFAEKGRHETIWIILRKFQYADSLSLKDTFLHPKFDVPAYASAELSPAGYRFFVDLFLRHDKDNDGGLNDSELATLFAPTPGIPTAWTDSDFPNCTVLNEAGHITLQGWLAQWSMTTRQAPRTTLEYLAYLGFESADSKGTPSALKLTKPRKRRGPSPADRTVLLCYVLGAPAAGKSSLLQAFLNRPFRSNYSPTTKPQSAVNSVEPPGGKQCYLILHELPASQEASILSDPAKLAPCDLLCYVYDSSDPDSFSHCLDLRARYPALQSMPSVFTALKADGDRAVQRTEMQPDMYCEANGLPKPLHVCARWDSIGDFFVHLAESSTTGPIPKREDGGDSGWVFWLGGIGAVVTVGVGLGFVWRRGLLGSSA